MDRDEVLSRAANRKANQMDEMEMEITLKGNGMATVGVLVFVLILMIVKMIKSQSWYDIFSLFFISMAIPRFYKGIKLKNFQDVAFGVGFGVLSVLFLASAVFTILR